MDDFLFGILIVSVILIIPISIYFVDKSDSAYAKRKNSREQILVQKMSKQCGNKGVKQFKFTSGSHIVTFTCNGGSQFVLGAR